MAKKPVTSPPLESAEPTRRGRGGHRPSGLSREQKEAAVREFEARRDEKGAAVDIATKLGVTATALYWWRKQMQQGWATGDPYKAARQAKAKARAKANGRGLPVRQDPIVATTTTRSHHDAILFLRKGKQELLRSIRSGKTGDFDNTHLLALLALNSLQDDE